MCKLALPWLWMSCWEVWMDKLPAPCLRLLAFRRRGPRLIPLQFSWDCGGQFDSGTGFSPHTSVFPVSIIPPLLFARISSIYHWGYAINWQILSLSLTLFLSLSLSLVGTAICDHEWIWT
jgi:hypothetical protein